MPLPKFVTQADVTPDWAAYLTEVYGPLPDTAFPLDLAKFDVFYKPLVDYHKLPVKPISSASGCPTAPGAFYVDMSGAHDPHGTIWQYQAPPYTGVPANTWVEGTHCADPDARAQEATGVWFYVARGSGIYVNTGNTKVYPDHADAVRDLLNQSCKGLKGGECSDQFPALIAAAAKAGYDTLQFTHHADMRCGNTAVELLVTSGSGAQACGAGISLKRGWGGSQPCVCDNTKSCTNCGLLDPLCGTLLQPTQDEFSTFRNATIGLGVVAGALLIAVAILAGFLGHEYHGRHRQEQLQR